MKTRNLLCLIFFPFFISCASKLPTSEVLANVNSTAKLDTIAVALQSAPIKVGLNSKIKSSLEAGNRSVSYKGFASYYRLFETDTGSREKLDLEIVSLCTCFGFDKRIAIPVPLVFDADGNQLEIADLQYKARHASFGIPFNITVKGSVFTKNTGKIRILMLADTSSVDRDLGGTKLVHMYSGELIMYLPVLSYPVGPFSLELGDLNNE
jgi:hypothetical protein